MTNHFSNNNRTTWLIALLVMLNVGTLATLWFSRGGGRQHSPPHEREHVVHFFADKLDLTETQQKEFKTLWDTFRMEVEKNRETLGELRRKRMEVMTQDSPDTIALNTLALEMGKKQTYEEELLSQHYYRLKSVCNVEQQKKLGDVFHDIMRRIGGKKGKRNRRH